MKFGFEHDDFSDEETDQTPRPSTDGATERTPLLASGNIAPTSDPAVAESTTNKTAESSFITTTESTLVESSESHTFNTTESRSQNRKDSSHQDDSSLETANIKRPGSHQENGKPISQSVATSSTPPVESSLAYDRATSDKPLPIQQILFLCVARVVEPIAFFSIFPYINQMCARNGNLQPSDTGFYSGLIEALFSLTQMSVMILWGRLADRFGRKPVLVLSLFGITFATTLFGLAQTIWQMVLFRCIAGIFAGTIVTIRAMITEHSTAKTQARAFSWFAFSGNLGIFLGPLIGGALADPNTQYPNVFHNIPFFNKYPYVLATLATGSIALVAAILSAIFVDETLPPTQRSNWSKSDPETDNSHPTQSEDTSTMTLLKAPGVIPVLYIYSHVMVLGLAFSALIPVFMYEPISLGGLSFSSLQISLLMAIIGASQAIWLLLIFPPLQHRIGTGGVLRLCAYSWPIFFVFVPLLNTILRQRTQTANTLFWILCPIILSVGVGVSMAFTAVQLALNDVTPSQRTLGTLNAIALTLVSGLRAVTPAVFPSVFAIGVRYQILWGYLAWLLMFVVAVGLVVAVRWLPEKAEGRVNEDPRGQQRQGQESEE